MNLTRLLKQTVEWEGQTPADAYGQRMYLFPTTLICRKTPVSKQFLTKEGELLITSIQTITIDPVAIGDLLDGREVIEVSAMVDIDGSTIGYKSFTR